MKKKIFLLCLAVLLVSTAVVGGTLAGFHTEAEQKGVAQIITKSLSIEIQGDKIRGNNQEIHVEEKVSPGGTVAFSRNILNSAGEGYDLYSRVTIYKRWNRDGLDSGKLHLYLGDTELTMENREKVKEKFDWILWYQDEEQVILYYRRPLAPGETSADVLTALGVDADVDNMYADAEAVLEFEVNAVQKNAAEDAIVAEWGVYPELNEDGYLVSISE